MSPDWVSLSGLSDSLSKDDAIPREVTEQVFDWFGRNLGQGKWKLEVSEIVKELGKATLSQGKVRYSVFIELHVTCLKTDPPRLMQNKPVQLSSFTTSWQESVGEQFSHLCDLESLKVSNASASTTI